MNDTLLESALATERTVRAALTGDASAADVSRALLGLRGRFTARECRYGCQMWDGNGRLWEENLLRLERMVRVAREARDWRGLRRALEIVLTDLEPLTGSAVREEAFAN